MYRQFRLVNNSNLVYFCLEKSIYSHEPPKREKVVNVLVPPHLPPAFNITQNDFQVTLIGFPAENGILYTLNLSMA